MWNAGLDKAQAGTKITGKNINNLRYADDTTLMAESEKAKYLWGLFNKLEKGWLSVSLPAFCVTGIL